MTPTHVYCCQSCGTPAWRVYVPKGTDPKQYSPTECGRCGSTLFTVRETKEAAA